MYRMLIFLICCLSISTQALATPSLNIPPRPAHAPSGSEFLKSIRSLAPAAREKAIAKEIARGNVPNFLRRLKPVAIDRQTIIWVTPDYLAIGSDQDFIRIPMSPITAQKIADQFGAVLPTPKIVDAVQHQATVKLNPSPLSQRGAKMTSVSAFTQHNRQIQRQIRGNSFDRLISGHKKDIVLTNRLANLPYRVAIYGWHRKNGKAIQPLSLVHNNLYADYSHGVRLVAQTVQYRGEIVTFKTALTNRSLATSLSYEKKFSTIRLATQSEPSKVHRVNYANSGKKTTTRLAYLRKTTRN